MKKLDQEFDRRFIFQPSRTGHLIMIKRMREAKCCRIILGRARAGVTYRLMEILRAQLPNLPPAGVLWLTPSLRAAQSVREQLVDFHLAPTLAFYIGTFDQIATRILSESGEVFIPLTRQMRWELIRLIVTDLAAEGKLKQLGSIAHTRGLVDQLYQWISHAERARIDLEKITVEDGRQLSLELQDFLTVLRQYHEITDRHFLFDADLRLWKAAELLEKYTPPCLTNLRVLVVDGFSDFSPAQLHLVEKLACRSDTILFGFQADESRPDVFAKPLKTISLLLGKFANYRISQERLEAEPKFEAPGLRHLERFLFTVPGTAPQAPSTAGLQILVGANIQQEVELVATEIKKLLVDGDPAYPGETVRPGDIVVVVRDFSEYGDRIFECSRTFGIPVYLEAGIPLRRVGPVAALLMVLELFREDWPLRQLLALMRNTYFRPKFCPADKTKWLPGLEEILRNCGVIKGLDAWQKHLSEYLSTNQVSNDASEHHPLHHAREIIDKLEDIFRRTCQPAAWREWVDRFRHLADICGITSNGQAETEVDFLDVDHPPTLAEQSSNENEYLQSLEWLRSVDNRGWRLFWEACVDLDRFYHRIGRGHQQLTLKEAVETVRRITEGWQIQLTPEGTGRVRVLSPTTFRFLKASYVFVMGLLQGSYPAAGLQATDWIETELAAMTESDGTTQPLRTRLHEEMLLFYQVVTRAARRLVLSYPAADYQGEPLLPSPFVHEVELACGGSNKITKQTPQDLSPLPRSSQPMSQAQWRLLAIDRAIQGDFSLLHSFCQHGGNQCLVENISRALTQRAERDQFRVFSRYEGMLTGPSVRDALQRAFSDDRPYSPTELENYAACPFRFFIVDLLGIEPLEEIVVKTDFLRRGQRFHAALCEFHRRLQAKWGSQLNSQILDQLSSDEFRRLWEESFEALPPETASPLDKARYELDKRLWRQLAPRYREQWKAYDALCQKRFGVTLSPFYFELWLGSSRIQESDGVSATRLIRLALDHKTRLKLSGRVDRVDIGQVAGQPVFAVIDYKLGKRVPVTSKDWVDNICRGEGLQLALYLYAMTQTNLIPQYSIPVMGAYWQLEDSGVSDRFCLLAAEPSGKNSPATGPRVTPTGTWQQIVNDALPTTCRSIITAMRKGVFPPAPASEDECRYCPCQRICRVAECRAYEKTGCWRDVTKT